MILDNPTLFKKVMLAYNASKRQAEKDMTKINIRKVLPKKEPNEVRSLPRPGDNRF